MDPENNLLERLIDAQQILKLIEELVQKTQAGALETASKLSPIGKMLHDMESFVLEVRKSGGDDLDIVKTFTDDFSRRKIIRTILLSKTQKYREIGERLTGRKITNERWQRALDNDFIPVFYVPVSKLILEMEKIGIKVHPAITDQLFPLPSINNPSIVLNHKVKIQKYVYHRFKTIEENEVWIEHGDTFQGGIGGDIWLAIAILIGWPYLLGKNPEVKFFFPQQLVEISDQKGKIKCLPVAFPKSLDLMWVGTKLITGYSVRVEEVEPVR